MRAGSRMYAYGRGYRCYGPGISCRDAEKPSNKAMSRHHAICPFYTSIVGPRPVMLGRCTVQWYDGESRQAPIFTNSLDKFQSAFPHTCDYQISYNSRPKQATRERNRLSWRVVSNRSLLVLPMVVLRNTKYLSSSPVQVHCRADYHSCCTVLYWVPPGPEIGRVLGRGVIIFLDLLGLEMIPLIKSSPKK